MKQLLIRSLWLSSFILFCFGCAPNSYKNLKKIETKTIDSTAMPSLFKNSNPAPLYKTDVNLYGKKFGGLLLVKNMPDSSYRIAFTTETGIKLFDFELKGEKFMVHYCIEKFNKDAVITTIANDLKLLLLENRINQKANLLTDSENKWIIYKFNDKENADYYFKDAFDKRLKKVEQSSGKNKKVVIDLFEYKGFTPSEMKITHKTIRLKIDLKLIER